MPTASARDLTGTKVRVAGELRPVVGTISMDCVCRRARPRAAGRHSGGADRPGHACRGSCSSRGPRSRTSSCVESPAIPGARGVSSPMAEDRFARTADRTAALQDERAGGSRSRCRRSSFPRATSGRSTSAAARARWALALAPLVREVVGVDRVPSCLSSARAARSRQRPFVEADATSLPFRGWRLRSCRHAPDAPSRASAGGSSSPSSPGSPDRAAGCS